MVENEIGWNIKKLRTNTCYEYENNIFKKLCYECGIRMERDILETPQHGGIVEQMNKTLTERARSLHVHACLPKQLWAEEVNTLTSLINHGSLILLEHAIPEEV